MNVRFTPFLGEKVGMRFRNEKNKLASKVRSYGVGD